LNLTTRIFSTALALLALNAASVSSGQHGDESDSAIDGIERKLETGSHGQLLTRISTTDVAIDPFTTDGCSGGLSLAWERLSDRFPEFANGHGNRPPWEECCIAHDQRYHAGGASAVSAIDSFEQRRDADQQLKACVVKTGVERSSALQNDYQLSEKQIEVLYQTIADLMYRAVRLGGMPCTDQSWRWGYGWPKCG